MGCGTSFVKYVLFFFNLLFALGGLAMVGIGAAFLLQLTEVKDLLQGKLEVAPWLFIIVGAVVFVIAFFGCCGAIRESHCMVVTYAVFLLVIIIIQVVLAVLVFLNIDDVEKFSAKALSQTFEKSKDGDKAAEQAFSSIEIQLQCCGVRGSIDYQNIKLPDSCCSTQAGLVQRYTGACTFAESRPGCMDALTSFARTAGKAIAGVAIGVAVIEVLGALFALCLANSIRNMDRRSRY